MKVLTTALTTIVITAGAVLQCVASPHIVPGKSLDPVHLGQSRAAVRAEMPSHPSSYTLRSGITEDLWTQGDQYISVLYKNGVAVQILAAKPNTVPLTFAQCISRDRALKPLCFNMGEGDIFCYDNQRAGIAYFVALQESMALSDHPDGVIIHKPGGELIPAVFGKYGARDKGEERRVFKNEASIATSYRKPFVVEGKHGEEAEQLAKRAYPNARITHDSYSSSADGQVVGFIVTKADGRKVSIECDYVSDDEQRAGHDLSYGHYELSEMPTRK